MNMSDIAELVLLCAIIFFWLGYAAHRRFPHLWQRLQNRLLSPRYLKSAGVWVREGSTSQIKRQGKP